MSDSWWPRRLLHSKPPCPSPSPRVCPSSCPLHQQCHPAISSSDAHFPSIKDFSSESAVRIRWPKYWSCSFSISPSNECSGLISFKIGLISLLYQGLSSLLQHHRLKASILQCSPFFNGPALQFLDYLRVIPVIFVAFNYHISCGNELFLIHRTQRTFFSQFEYIISYMLKLNKKLGDLTSDDPGFF